MLIIKINIYNNYKVRKKYKCSLYVFARLNIMSVDEHNVSVIDCNLNWSILYHSLNLILKNKDKKNEKSLLYLIFKMLFKHIQILINSLSIIL